MIHYAFDYGKSLGYARYHSAEDHWYFGALDFSKCENQWGVALSELAEIQRRYEPESVSMEHILKIGNAHFRSVFRLGGWDSLVRGIFCGSESYPVQIAHWKQHIGCKGNATKDQVETRLLALGLPKKKYRQDSLDALCVGMTALFMIPEHVVKNCTYEGVDVR